MDKIVEVGKVIKIIDDNTIIIGNPKHLDIKRKQILAVCDYITDVIDPETQKRLGRYNKPRVTIMATEIFEHFVVCTRKFSVSSGTPLSRLTGPAFNALFSENENEIKKIGASEEIEVGDLVQTTNF